MELTAGEKRLPDNVDCFWRAFALLPYKLLRQNDVRPYATYAILAMCIGFFFWELSIPRGQFARTLTDVSITGCQITGQFFAPKTWVDTLRSMFLHGGFAHLFGNMLYLLIFGPAVEEYFGWKKFMGFYILAGIAAALSHVFVSSTVMQACSTVPLVGASGAIAGILGGFILLYPGTKVRTMIPLFRGFGPMYDMPAIVVLGFWFVLQMISGMQVLDPQNLIVNRVAFWAHIGGFIFGAITIFIATTFVPAPDQNLTHDE